MPVLRLLPVALLACVLMRPACDSGGADDDATVAGRYTGSQTVIFIDDAPAAGSLTSPASTLNDFAYGDSDPFRLTLTK